MKRLRIPKWLKFTVATAALLTIVVMIGAYAWLRGAPRDVAWLMPRVHAALEEALPGWEVSFGSANAEWGGFGHPLTLHFQDATAISPEKRVALSIPDLRVGLHPLPLLIGNAEPAIVRLSRPTVKLQREAGLGIAFPWMKSGAPEESDVPWKKQMEDLRHKWLEHVQQWQLQRIILEDAKLLTSDDSGGQEVELAHVNLRLRRQGGKVNLHAELLGGTEHKKPILMFDLKADKEKNTDIRLTLQGVNPKQLANAIPAFSEEGVLDAALLGEAHVVWLADGTWRDGNFALSAAQGTVVSGQHFKEAFDIRNFLVKGTIVPHKQGGEITITHAGATLGKAVFQAQGTWVHDGATWNARLEITGRNMPTNEIERYWPTTLKPNTRNWVTTRIRNGHIPFAIARLHLTPEDFEQFPARPELLEAEIQVENADVAYVPGLPTAHEVSGIVRFSARDMHIDIEHGRTYDQSQVTGGVIEIIDFAPYDPVLSVRLDIDSTAPEIVRYLGEPYLNHARKIDLTPDRASGPVKGKVDIWFPLADVLYEDAPTPPELIRYTITGEIAGGSAKGVVERLDFEKADVRMKVDNQTITAEGKGDVNGVPLTMQWTTWLGKNTEWDNAYRAQGTVPAEALERFRLPRPLGVSGNIGAEIHTRMKDDLQLVEGRLVLDNAGLEDAAIGLKKEPGKKLSADFILETGKDDVVTISKLNAEGENIHVAGNLRLDEKDSTLLEAALDPVVYGKTDARLRYAYAPAKGYAIDLQGHSFDLTPFLKTKSPQEKLPPFTLKAKLDSLYLSGGELVEVTAAADCRDVCENFTFRAQAGKPVTAYIKRGEKGRQFTLVAEDGGTFAQRLGIHDHISAGPFTATGTFQDDAPGRPLSGSFSSKDMLVAQAPMLAKLLSLVSFSGLADALSGKGIRFDTIEGKFEWMDKKLLIKEAYLFGSAMGITTQGEVNLNKDTLALQGTIVPAYMLNSVFGNIPLLGPLLSGGETKGGMFAANYSVKGAMGNPDISVNPLSMLAPGFLRGIFGIFDGGKGDVKEPPAKEPAVKESPKEATPGLEIPEPSEPQAAKP